MNETSLRVWLINKELDFTGWIRSVTQRTVTNGGIRDGPPERTRERPNDDHCCLDWDPSVRPPRSHLLLLAVTKRHRPQPPPLNDGEESLQQPQPPYCEILPVTASPTGKRGRMSCGPTKISKFSNVTICSSLNVDMERLVEINSTTRYYYLYCCFRRVSHFPR